MKSLLRLSTQMYDIFLRFYPAPYRHEFGDEMKYVYLKSLKDAYRKEGFYGLVKFWLKTLWDGLKSLFTEHVKNSKSYTLQSINSEKRGAIVKDNSSVIMQNKVFAYIAAGTAALLSLPYLAMRYNWVKPDPTNPRDVGVKWSLGDFLIMGVLLFGAGTLFVVIARIIPAKHRLLVGMGVLALFLLIWIHLAVGIVDSWPLAGS